MPQENLSPSNEYRISVNANMVGEQCTRLETVFASEMEKADKPVVLDLRGVSSIDSRGIGLCVGMLRECQRKQLSFRIELRPELHKFFKLLKLDKVLTLSEAGAA